MSRFKDPATRSLSRKAATLLMDRLEAAIEDGRLVLGCEQYGRLLGVLFPEQYHLPDEFARRLSEATGVPVEPGGGLPVVLRQAAVMRQAI